MSVAAGRPALGARAATMLRRLGVRPGQQDPALVVVNGSLHPDERVEATAYCSTGVGGLGEAGLVALTDRRIVFVPRKGNGPVRSYAYTLVRAVHEEGAAGMRRRIRVALSNARPLHLVAGTLRMGADPCEIIRRHCRIV